MCLIFENFLDKNFLLCIVYILWIDFRQFPNWVGPSQHQFRRKLSHLRLMEKIYWHGQEQDQARRLHFVSQLYKKY